MAGSFQSALLGGQKTIRDVTGQEVTVTRGAVSVKLVAVPAESEHDQQVEQEYQVTFVVTDFLIFKVDLKTLAEPERGDRITIDKTGEIFEVMPTDILPPWNWVDTYHKQYRVHCKTVKS